MCSQGWLETILMMLALMNLLLLSAFLAACTCRVLLGGTGRVVPTQEERRDRRRRAAEGESGEAEARVGQIDLGDEE